MSKKILYIAILILYTVNYTKGQTTTSWINYISRQDSFAIFTPGNGFFVDNFGYCYTGFNYYGTISIGNISAKPSSSMRAWNDFAVFRVSAKTGNALWVQKSSNLKSTNLVSISPDGLGGLFGLGTTQDNPLTLGGKSLNTSPNGNLFLAGYDSSGNLKILTSLAKNMTSSSGTAFSSQILGAKNQHVYISSSFVGTVQFDTFTRSASSNQYDIFLAKYDSIGKAIWINTDLRSTSAQIQAITSDSKGNVYVSGEFNGDLYLLTKDIFTNPSLGGGADGFIAKYDSTGKLLWIGHISGPAAESVTGLSVDASDNVYGIGSYSGQVSIGSDIVHGPTNGSYICKFNSNGAFSWLKGINTLGGQGQGVSLCFAYGNLIVGCSYDDAIIINHDTLTYSGTEKNPAYAYNSVLIQYDTAGNAISYMPIKSSKSAQLSSIGSYNDNIYGYGGYINDVSVSSNSISTPGKYDYFMFNTPGEWTGIPETHNNTLFFKIYPNPTTGYIYFNSPMNGLVEVHDMMGRIVLKVTARQNEISTLNLNGLEAGVYILSIATNNGFYSQKIVKK